MYIFVKYFEVVLYYKIKYYFLAIPKLVMFIILITFIFSCEKKELPGLTTDEIFNITGTTAQCGGVVISEGTGTIIAKGVCWSLGKSPSINDNKTQDGSGTGSFISNLSGLNGATTYFVRAYATNSVGTGYGISIPFTTLGQVPTIMGAPATNIGVSKGTLNAFVAANFLSTMVSFEYGVTTDYGYTISVNQSPLTGDSLINISTDISGLTAGTTYHFRVKASNSLGTSFGNDFTFTTLGQIPSVMTLSSSDISISSAILNGFVNANYLSTIVTFEYGTSINYSNSSTAIQSPLNGYSGTSVNTIIEGLNSGVTYHFRIRAKNSIGESFSNDMIFTTLIKDIDGNVYHIIHIGNQEWLSENLKTTKYNDNSDIPKVTDANVWNFISTAAYCWYNNDSAKNKNTNGALYNWNTVKTSKLCPIGWHVPSDNEWTVLINFLGGESVSGGKLKERDFSHWHNPNYGATDEVGFMALPGGLRFYGGAYEFLSYGCYWWSSFQSTITGAWGRSIQNSSSSIDRGIFPTFFGLSVRCIRD
jgi:uncharacterized protein (TIGR02145 family)